MTKETELQHRLKSPVFWTAVTAQVLSLLMVLGVIDTGLSETIEHTVCILLELMVTFGILNNPTSKGAF